MHCIYNAEACSNGIATTARRSKLIGSTQPRLRRRSQTTRCWFTSRTLTEESRYVYYGETARLRHLAVILTERRGKIRVITAYDLDAGQKRDYLERRARGD